MRGAPLGAIRIEARSRTLHHPLAPAALRDEHLVLCVHEMLVYETAPVAQPHGVILANAEALLLMRADHISDQVSKQPPVVELALPRLHGVVVRAAIKAQRKQTLERFLCKEEGAAGSKHTLHLQKHAFHVHELAQHLKRHYESQRAISEGQVDGVPGHSNGRA